MGGGDRAATCFEVKHPRKEEEMMCPDPPADGLLVPPPASSHPWNPCSPRIPPRFGLRPPPDSSQSRIPLTTDLPDSDSATAGLLPDSDSSHHGLSSYICSFLRSATPPSSEDERLRSSTPPSRREDERTPLDCSSTEEAYELVFMKQRRNLSEDAHL